MENPTENHNQHLTNTDLEQANDRKHITLSREDRNLYIERLKLEQNLLFGFTGGLAASLIGAILWAIITVVTNFQIGYMAVAIGFLVGYAIRYMGKGIDPIFGVLGSVLSLSGCLLGNFLSIVGFAAKNEGINYFDLLMAIDYSLVPQIMIDSFSPMDILFYGFALYEGYKFSFREITEGEIVAGPATK
jgi:hypothetical protein